MPFPISEDLHACLDRLEQQLGHMKVSDMTMVWDDSDRPSIVSSLTSFQMPNIKRFTYVGCPRAHLRPYSLVMRSFGRDEGQLVALFPLFFSGLA